MGKNWRRIGALTVVVGALCLMIGYFWGTSAAGGTIRLRGDTSSQTETLPVSEEPMATVIPSVAPAPTEEIVPTAETASSVVEENETAETESTDKININTATSEELQSLPGIGEARAEAIINYRNENGPFRTTEELMLISGIGEKIYAQLEDKVTV